MNTGKLHERIAAVAPIDGVSVGVEEKKDTWRIDFKKEATEDQIAAAKAIIENWTDVDNDGTLEERKYIALEKIITLRIRKMAIDAERDSLVEKLEGSSLDMLDILLKALQTELEQLYKLAYD